ncbi:MAG: [FeFe] hydrogenase, group A [bacterium]|nr:[FeFe] hydrogenase, group A [bacterium]
MVNVKINGIDISVQEGTTILEAARQAGIKIPTLCYLENVSDIGACRVCVVEVEGIDRCVTACNNVVEEGMVIYTNSKKARLARRTNVQLILSQHDFKCASCVRNTNCALQDLASELNIREVPFKELLEKEEWDKNFPLIRDSEKCIKCMRCVQTCDKVQQLHVWDVHNTGGHTTVGVRGNQKISDVNCSLCGQCITHCPVGALRARDDVERVYEALEDPDMITVVQMAPAVRTAWGESLGLSKEFATANRIADGLKKMGFDYVFDTVFSADLTIMEEGSEFLERLPEIKESGIPMFTSCCPGWVRFIKSEFPEMFPRLSTAKSPQQMFGAATKSYFAEKIGVDPDRIFSVSIMPCVAKKDECTWDGRNDVDVVLTTRELERLFRASLIDVEKLEEAEFDSPLGEGTGAGVIFGVTGGVMEAALRSAYYLATGSNPPADAFKEVRGPKPWREATFDVDGTPIRVAVTSGLGNARALVTAIKNKEVQYDFVEVMACPGGCVNGGGQPYQDKNRDDMVGVRTDVLYSIDSNMKIRFSHENSEVLQAYEEYFEKPLSHKAHELLHVHTEEH